MCAAAGLLGSLTNNKPMGMAGLIPAAFQAQQRNAAKKPAARPMSTPGLTSTPPPSTMMK
jgi:hypothetical protein